MTIINEKFDAKETLMPSSPFGVYDVRVGVSFWVVGPVTP
jgi:hypothetical protein